MNFEEFLTEGQYKDPNAKKADHHAAEAKKREATIKADLAKKGISKSSGYEEFRKHFDAHPLAKEYAHHREQEAHYTQKMNDADRGRGMED